MTEAIVLEEEQRADRFTELVERLSHQSVVKHFDAYVDVPWDDPAYAIDPTDPRWELSDAAPARRDRLVQEAFPPMSAPASGCTASSPT